MNSSFVSSVAALILGSLVPAVVGQEARPSPDRALLVRQMFEKVPPLILAVAEPIEILKANVVEDGGTTTIALRDARGKSLSFRLDRRRGSPTREEMFLAEGAAAEAKVTIRGPEEAALFGLLLRWKAGPRVAPETLDGVRAMLNHLEARFSASEVEKTRGQVVRRILNVDLALEKKFPPNLVVTVVGQVPTPGYTEVRLTRVVHARPPSDGIQEYRLTAVAPTGFVPQVLSKVEAFDRWQDFSTEAPWLRGVRIHGVDGGIVVKMLDQK